MLQTHWLLYVPYDLVPINYSNVPNKVFAYVDTWQTGKLHCNLVMRVLQSCGGDRFSWSCN